MRGAGAAEGGGTGIPDIIGIYGRKAFYFSNSITRLTLKFDKSMEEAARKTAETNQKTTQKITQKITQKTTQKTTQKILDAIKINPSISRRELAEILGLSQDGIKWNLNRLQESGSIRRVGPDKGERWEIM